MVGISRTESLVRSIRWLPDVAVRSHPALERFSGARRTICDERSIRRPAVQGFFGRATRTFSTDIECALMYAPAVWS